MSDLRFDPVFNCWVAIAENRRDRPIEFVPLEQVRKPLICPFCSGNEEETPPAIAIYDEMANLVPPGNTEEWSTRVIPNKFPFYPTQNSANAMESGPYQMQTALGQQEIIIPTPRHICSLSELTDTEWIVSLIAAQQRIKAWRADPSILHAMWFKNCRFEAGASIEHIHYQLVGSPIASPFLLARADRFKDHRDRHNESLIGSICRFELNERRRIVAELGDWTMFCPLASRMAFQVWIVSKDASMAFDHLDHRHLKQLAELVGSYVKRIEMLFGQPGYNLMLHQLPFSMMAIDHWFLEIVPRLSKSAGYELGTEIWVNPVSPEMAAKRLR